MGPGLAWGGRAKGSWAAARQCLEDEPRSYRSACVRSQVLEVGAVDGLQGLKLVVLSLQVALRWLVPAAPGNPTAPSHGKAAADAGPPRGGGGGPRAGSRAGLSSQDWLVGGAPRRVAGKGQGTALGGGAGGGAPRSAGSGSRGRRDK